MGFLRTDYDGVNTEFAPLPIGNYECIVSEAKAGESSGGKPMLKVTLTVRDDVEQEGAKRKFFDNVVEQENMNWKFQQIAKAVQIPAGTDIATLADFAAAILYKPVMIRNVHKMFEEELQDKIKVWKVSEQEGYTGGEPGMNPGGETIDVEDEDLPF